MASLPRKTCSLGAACKCLASTLGGSRNCKALRSTKHGLGVGGFSLSDDKQGARQIEQIPRSRSQPGGELEAASSDSRSVSVAAALW